MGNIASPKISDLVMYGLEKEFLLRENSQSRMEAKPFDGLLVRKRIDGLFY